jgi:hypothetical protein
MNPFGFQQEIVAVSNIIIQSGAQGLFITKTVSEHVYNSLSIKRNTNKSIGQ